MTVDDRVCPRCGSLARDAIFCTGCGLNLHQQGELPSAEAFAARQREEAWLAKEEARRIEAEEPARSEPNGEQGVEGGSADLDGDLGEEEVEERDQGSSGASQSHAPHAVAGDTVASRGRALSVLGIATVGVLVLAGGAALVGYGIGRGAGGDLEAAREAGARAGQQEGTQRGGERGYNAGFQEARREASTDGESNDAGDDAAPARGNETAEPSGDDLESLAAEEIAQDGLTLDPEQTTVEESTVDPGWAVVSGFATEGESWAVWFEDGQVVANGFRDADRPGDAPCDLAPFSEDRC